MHRSRAIGRKNRLAIVCCGAPARHRAFALIAAFLLALGPLVGAPFRDPAAASAAAATGRPLAVIVVGPVEGKTSEYVRDARQIAAQLRSYGAGVREIYSPNATWSRVSEASRGANLLVYLGHGRGYPSPDGAFDPRTMNGLGLNRTLARGHANVRFYGEYHVRRSLRLAPGAVVILSRVPYAAGSSEPGHAFPARSTATKRADNYAAGFLGAGARVVFANDRSVATIVRDLFGANLTMRSVFWRSPSASTQYDSTFTSTRTSGSSGVLAPDSSGQYYESVVGRLQWTTTDWQQAPSPTVRVTSIPALLTALANNAVTEIVVANGTYRIAPAANRVSNSLWIGARFAGRTSPVLVRAETTGGVIFDGGGGWMSGITFAEGAHHQTWQGFKFTNGTPNTSGVIVFGGYSLLAAPHHITLRNIEISGLTKASDGKPHGYMVYSSMSAAPGPHDILFEDFTSIDTGQISGHFHWYHDYLDAERSPAGNYNAQNVVVRRAHLTGPAAQVGGGTNTAAFYIWASTLNNLLIEDTDIHNAAGFVIRYEGGTGVVLRRVVSTGTGLQPFYSSKGANPPGVTFESSSLR